MRVLVVTGSRAGGSSSCSSDTTRWPRLRGEPSIRVLRNVEECEQGSVKRCQGGRGRGDAWHLERGGGGLRGCLRGGARWQRGRGGAAPAPGGRGGAACGGGEGRLADGLELRRDEGVPGRAEDHQDGALPGAVSGAD